MAREMVADGLVHCEADMVFTVDGAYAYDPAPMVTPHHGARPPHPAVRARLQPDHGLPVFRRKSSRLCWCCR